MDGGKPMGEAFARFGRGNPHTTCAWFICFVKADRVINAVNEVQPGDPEHKTARVQRTKRTKTTKTTKRTQ